jgi:dienelactone hydrolase
MICLCFPIVCWGQTLIITPTDSVMDETLSIRVSSLPPNQPIIIRASTQDTNGKLWQSFAGFYADKNGMVDLSIQSPIHETYSGINPMGLIQSMNVSGADYNRTRFAFKRFEPIKFKFILEIEGKTIATTEITRSFIKPNIKVSDVRENGLVGTLFTPADKKDLPAVLVLGGSEGGLSSEDVAAMLANHGYATLALAYFGAENLPQSLEEIPLEYFKKAIDFLQQKDFIRKNGVAILGTSKGAEAALLIASKYKEVRAVIAYAPSSVVWSCICNTREKSSWSDAGKSVPSIPFLTSPTYLPPQGFPISPKENYQYRLEKATNLNEATIQVERINGAILLISGEDDQLWMSTGFGEMIIKRLKKYKFRFLSQHLIYKSAGHLIGKSFLPSGSTLIANGRLQTGGTSEGNSGAQKDAWAKVLKFLKMNFVKIS